MSTRSPKLRLSRRQLIGWALVSLGAACAGCRDRNDPNATPGKAPQQAQTTNTPPKWPDNVAGRFFVTQNCIDCDLCRDIAPAIFARNEREGYAFVRKQPASDSEVQACLEAAEGCPVEAIIDAKQ